MIGLIHRTLFDLVSSVGGPQAREEIKRRAGVPLEQHFSIGDVYPDEQWQALFAATCEVLQLPPGEAEEKFAEAFLADALRRWPVWFQMARSARDLMERQPVIHNSLATGVQDPAARKAVQDKFRVERREGELLTHYCSPNRLCGLYIALVQRVLAYYRENATVEELQCMKHGAAECIIRTRWI